MLRRTESSMATIKPKGEEDQSDKFVEIFVRNARTHIENGKAQFTDYEVEVKTNLIAFTLKHSKVRRRYSDFIWLRRHLAKDLMNKAPPTLPGRRLFGRFKKDFIKQRQNKLQKFLSGVVQNNIFLSHSALHLFLQSKLTVKEIEDYIESNGDEDPSEKILAGLPLAFRLRSESESHLLPYTWSRSSSDSAIDSCHSEYQGSEVDYSDLNQNLLLVSESNEGPVQMRDSGGNSADDEEDGDDESGVALEDEKEAEQRLLDLRFTFLNLKYPSQDVESSVEYLFDNDQEELSNHDATKRTGALTNENFRPFSRKRRRSKRRKPHSVSQFCLTENPVSREDVNEFDLSKKVSTVRRCYSYYRLPDSSFGMIERLDRRLARTQSCRSRQRCNFVDELRAPVKRKISLNEYCIVKRDSVLSNCSFEETGFNKSL